MIQDLLKTLRSKRSHLAIGAGVVSIVGFAIAKPCEAQLCAFLTGGSYKQSFDTLPASGTSNNSNSLPQAWNFSEAGTGGTLTYAADNGSLATGNTYSYGASGNSDRAFGELTSGTVESTIGACFLNDTGLVINSLSIAYTGEMWRLGAADAIVDRLDFEFSTNATSIVDEAPGVVWTAVNSLDFVSPNNTAPAGAKDGNAAANRTTTAPIAVILPGGVPDGGVFYIHWLSTANIGGTNDGLAIDDFKLNYNPSADFNQDTFVDGADLLNLLKGYGNTSGSSISQGDANRDGATDALDFAIWRSQFNAIPAGSGTGNGVNGIPEPAPAILVILAACFAAFAKPRRLRLNRAALLIAIAWLLITSPPATAQNVSLSLNIFPTSNANPNAGGAWVLVAKTDSPNGIAAVNALISNINSAGIAYGAGINAALDHGAPYIQSGTPLNVVYFQDFAESNVVVGVGTTAFSSDLDPLGSAAFDNATRIMSGTYNSTLPAFAPKNGQTTDALVLSTNTPPFHNASDANTTLTARTAISGDYNLNGKLDAADYVVWRNNLGSATSLRNDNTPGVGPDDYTRWRSNFGSPAGSGLATATAVPEASSLALIAIGGVSLVSSRRRFT